MRTTLLLLSLSALIGLVAGDVHAGKEAPGDAERAAENSNGLPTTLEYRWPAGESLPYRAQLYLALPRGWRLFGTQNIDARVSEVTMGALLNCTPEPSDGRRQKVACEVASIELGAMTMTGEDAKAKRIVDEIATDLESAMIQLVLNAQGRILELDVKGLSNEVSRETYRREQLRILVRHALSPLELEMPKGEVPRSQRWRQRGAPMALRLPSDVGTAGGIRMTHELIGVNEARIAQIHTRAEATLLESSGLDPASRGRNITGVYQESSGITQASSPHTGVMGGGIDQRSELTVSTSLVGDALFDMDSGLLVSSRQELLGSYTAQSNRMGRAPVIHQIAQVELLSATQ